ncbi:SNF2 family N-terminal domain-containing protein [Umbelopsis sp. AD052]|nr:SNF2 family N-terminal domain-containing protein [Umbelopsis sp. AD052]
MVPTKKARFTSKNSKENIVVRFITSKGVEFGRLPSEVSKWVSKLLDFEVCNFYGTVISCNPVLSTGDDIIVQLSCYFTPKAFASFDASNQAQLSMLGIHRSSSKTPIFDKGAETDSERLMKERKVAILSLLKALGLSSIRSSLSKTNEILGGEETVRELINQSAAQDDQQHSSGTNDEEGESAEEEVKEVSDNRLDALYEKAQMMDSNLDEMEAPEDVALNLRSYQKQALSWMMRKENMHNSSNNNTGSLHPLWEEYQFPTDPWKTTSIVHEKFYMNPFTGEMSLEFKSAESACRGGILADEMGLGKTIEMLSIVHANRPAISKESILGKRSPPRNPFHSSEKSSKLPSPTTLIVCPMSLLGQWRDEFLRGSKENTLKVEVYYGTSRDSSLVSRLQSWNGAAPDVLITTYGTVLSEWMSDSNTKDLQSGLYSVDFWRVILDEAHHIKNRLSKTSKACSALSANRRWVVTGTPIQNKLDDLYALVHFLKHEPWSNYSFWRAFITIPFQNKDVRAYDVVQTVLEPIVLRRTKTMRDAQGNLLVTLPSKQIDIEYLDFTPEEQDIYNSLYTDSKTKFSYFCAAGKALSNYASIFQLLMRLRQVSCHPYLVVKDGIDKESGSVSLEELLEKFQNSTSLDAKSGASPGDQNTYGINVLQRLKSQQIGEEEGDSECAICFESAESAVLMPCMHMACRACVLDFLQKREDDGLPGECPICRHGPISEANLLEVIKKRRKSNISDAVEMATSDKKKETVTFNLRRSDGFKTSSKLDALLRHLRQTLGEKTSTGEPIKSVVFSQFTTFLDLIEVALTIEGMPFTRLDGTQSQLQREKALKEFREGDITVMLISLRAGGVGLNLTCASKVYMMDPWWNFATEAQAIDRVHRLGQKQEVTVKRFIMRSTVEEKILAIQERKSVSVVRWAAAPWKMTTNRHCVRCLQMDCTLARMKSAH